VFLGLQLFPEASMDYWLESQAMLAHDDVLVRYCEVLGRAGYRIFVKDHPLQFGFRQRELFERLAKLPGVVLVPYDVPANLLIGKCAVSVTFTGTIGFQAALAGLISVATEPYYATGQHFVHIRDTNEIDGLAERLARWHSPDDLATTRRAIMRHLASISVEGDYFGWRKFDPDNEALRASVEPLARSLNAHLPRFIKSCRAVA
jgi:capsule polysaccharide modification protein KpsS